MNYREFKAYKNPSNYTIDLHIHSKNSDGSMTTGELMGEFERLQIDIVSFTDHDCVDCYYDLKSSPFPMNKEISIVPGVELSFLFHGELKDMLGYGIDVDVVDAFLKERYAYANRIQKQKEILEEFKAVCRKEKLVFDEDIAIEIGHKGEAFNLMYKSLVKHPGNLEKYGFIAENSVFYRNYFANKQSGFFVDETFGLPALEDVIAIIHKAGGSAFLAHPCAYSSTREKTGNFICEAADAGIDGLEVLHSSNMNDDVAFLQEIAQKNKLFMCGGSDFHGDTKPSIQLIKGSGNIHVGFDLIKSWIGKTKIIV